MIQRCDESGRSDDNEYVIKISGRILKVEKANSMNTQTVFNDTNKVPAYTPAYNRADYIGAQARTVIIDNRLLDENQKHQYHFALGHEDGYGILTSDFTTFARVWHHAG